MRTSASERSGDLVYADKCGLMLENSFSGYRYFVNFKNDYSKFRIIYFLKRKSGVANKLKVFLAEAKTLEHTAKQLLSDGGGEFDNRDVRPSTDNVDLHYRITMFYSQEQNDAAERDNCTLVEVSRFMLQS